MSADPAVDLVHAPIAHWAQTRGEHIAIRSGEYTLSFAQLQQQLAQRAATLGSKQAAATLLVDTTRPVAQRLVEFLAIIASGRCAVVGDPDWPMTVREAIRDSLPTQACDMPAAQPMTPFYVGYTSGSSGTPKGYRRHHRSWTTSFQACLDAFGKDAAGCVLAPGRDSHSLFLFGMLLGLWSGGGVVVQEQFSASAALHTLRSGQTPCLVAVPSQLLLMMEVARHQALPPITPVRLILISGARWPRNRTAELRALFAGARIIEFYGASETSFIAWMDTDETAPAAVAGWPFDNVQLQLRDTQANDGASLIYVRSPMVFMDYVGAAQDATAALRDGDWICVRDLGYLDPQGRLCVVGRQNRMIVTLGKNLFPEEVESVLERHPAIASASVHGVSDALRGTQVVAVIRWAPDPCATDYPHALTLKAWCKQHLEGFKVPRKIFTSTDWRWTASGKTDHGALAQDLLALASDHCAGSATLIPSPCLHTLP